MRNNLVLLLLESAVALVPPKYRNHPSVKNWCKRFGRKPSEAILDINYHFSIMKSFDHPGKWGRPDILHFTLLYALESPLSRAGKLRVYVHTVEDKLFYVEPDTRLPRGYSRFIGLLSQVLRGIDTPKVHPLDIDVVDLIERLRSDGYRIVLLTEEGERKGWDWLKGNTLVMVGAFSRGPFYRSYPADERVSIWDGSLNAWNVVGEVIASKERMLKLL